MKPLARKAKPPAVADDTIARLSRLIDTQTAHIRQLESRLAYAEARVELLTAVVAGQDEALGERWWDEVDMVTGEVTRIPPNRLTFGGDLV
jgi:uncharacterized coiled-coil protein SlyX